LREDIAAQRSLFSQMGMAEPCAVAFPSGKFTDIANAVLVEEGYDVTLTTDPYRVNVLVPGLPQSLVGLGRLNVGADTTAEELLAYCEK